MLRVVHNIIVHNDIIDIKIENESRLVVQLSRYWMPFCEDDGHGKIRLHRV
jgi:hypothetical protein